MLHRNHHYKRWNNDTRRKRIFCSNGSTILCNDKITRRFVVYNHINNTLNYI
ncbi:hypothetical protein KAU43_07800 [candidate division WOR-3 bacterium]|nr:hypothetical protein [candidate division WOR-3 bacterium]